MLTLYKTAILDNVLKIYITTERKVKQY